MLTGLPIPSCRELLGSVAGFGCLMSDLARVARNQGYQTAIVQQPTPLCIIRIGLDDGSHFVIRENGWTLDPAKGRYAALPENIQEILSLSK